MPSQHQFTCFAGLSVTYFLATNLYNLYPSGCANSFDNCTPLQGAFRSSLFVGLVQSIHNIFYNNDFINSLSNNSVFSDLIYGANLLNVSLFAQTLKFIGISSALSCIVSSDVPTIMITTHIINILTSAPIIEIFKRREDLPAEPPQR